ncbi:MAG: D-2-hydroxyacid dehydrogenase [Actinomycetota bacterium]
MTRAQLSAEALARWGDPIRRVVPDVELVAYDPDLKRIPGDPPEVGWLSVDVLRSADPEFVAALAAAEPLRFVQSAGAGHDTWHFTQLLARNVRLCTAHVNDVPIAEYVLRAVLDRFQRADRWRAGQAHHHWEHHEWREVAGSTWLVVGVGAIGAAVAQRARAFGARVVGVRRTPDGNEPVDEMVGPGALPARLPHADVVVLSLPGGPETRNLVDAPFLAAMRTDAVLVNVARGSIVDEEALITALDAGRPDFAVLDVTHTEPLPPESPLWAHPRIVVTPHSSSGGHGRFARGADLFAENLRRYTTGEPLLHEV